MCFIDIDECHTGSHLCPGASTCEDTTGAYICHCSYGFFSSQGTCKGEWDMGQVYNMGYHVSSVCIVLLITKTIIITLHPI